MFYAAFPDELREDINVVLKVLLDKKCVRTYGDGISYTIHNGIVEIPYRIYSQDIADADYAPLTPVQKQILCCIYTRNSSGYIREKYLRRLLDMPFEEWAFPFIVKLCDEYVLEIIEVIYSKLNGRDNTDIQNFCLQNKPAIKKSYARMISYWDFYYRDREYYFHNYVGRRLFRDCLGYNRSFER